jgi:hypothetical protein
MQNISSRSRNRRGAHPIPSSRRAAEGSLVVRQPFCTLLLCEGGGSGWGFLAKQPSVPSSLPSSRFFRHPDERGTSCREATFLRRSPGGSRAAKDEGSLRRRGPSCIGMTIRRKAAAAGDPSTSRLNEWEQTYALRSTIRRWVRNERSFQDKRPVHSDRPSIIAPF